jgi:hypothetical protein
MSFRNKVRKFQTETGKTFPKSSGKIVASEDDDFTSVIAETLRDAFGRNRAAAKSLMRITGAGERTVKNWLEGKNAPSGKNLVELVRHSDGVLEALLLMAGRDKILAMKKLMNARDTLVQMIELIDELVTSDLDEAQ